MPSESTCPDGQPHVWKIPTFPGLQKDIYPSECSRCHQKKDLTSKVESKYSQGPGLFRKHDKPKTQTAAKRKSRGFLDREVMKAREQEYLSRKVEIITAYLSKGSAYGAAKQLKIPESSLRQLLKRWDNDVREFKARLDAAPGTFYTQAEITSIFSYGDFVMVQVKISSIESQAAKLRLGTVEIRYPEAN